VNAGAPNASEARDLPPVVAVRARTVAARHPPAKGRGRSVVTPLDVFDDGGGLSRGEASAGLPPAASWAVVVLVEDAEGTVGVGTAGFGNPVGVPLVEQLAPIVVGSRATEVSRLWETMFRATVNIGRRGVVLHAISGIDIAMWDLLGRQLGMRVVDLLGGPVRSTQPAYASSLYATEDLDALGAEAAGYAAEGFGGVKQRLAYGPADGSTAIARNVELIQTVVEAVGPSIDVMADAYMGWTLEFAVRQIRAIEDAGIRLRWLEEPLMPDDLEGYARLRGAVATPIAAGEHEATRSGFRELITREAVDVLQPDANRLGGITEARKVWALGESFGLPVIAHLGVAHNLHLSLASMASPLVEWMPPPRSGADPDEDQLLWALLGRPEVKDGAVIAPGSPGLGIDLDEDLLDRVTAVDDRTREGER
jgi:L-alanine-DL-glutamate epimerase-like enolase superfamily enzyme